MAEVQSRMSVATSERDLLLKQQADAKGEGGEWRAHRLRGDAAHEAGAGACAPAHACMHACNRVRDVMCDYKALQSSTSKDAQVCMCPHAYCCCCLAAVS
jgi:hypothetical protein